MPKRERKQRDNRRGENRGRRKGKPQTIQCHSIFEQGPADTPRKTGSRRWYFVQRYVFAYTSDIFNLAGWVAAAGVCDATAFPNCKTVKKEPQDSDDEDELLRKLQRDDVSYHFHSGSWKSWNQFLYLANQDCFFFLHYCLSVHPAVHKWPEFDEWRQAETYPVTLLSDEHNL